jgi:hypothetical protein
MILYGQDLVKTLREHCDNAKVRIWIATPFIGKLKEVERILGGKWRNTGIDFRILTDAESGFIREDTYFEFTSLRDGCVRSLHSLHAKIFIVDDWCLLTSANLTGTAFSCRFEIGTEEENIDSVVDYYNTLWDHEDAWEMDEWIMGDELNHKYYEDNKQAFKKKWELPNYSSEFRKQEKFEAKCSIFIKFAHKYQEVTGRNNQMVKDGFTLLQEVDFMFNYLEHVIGVSKSLKMPAVFSESIEERILMYFKMMSKFYKSEYDDVKRRLRGTRNVKKLTSPSRIMKLSKSDVESVLNEFNCLNSHGNKQRILSLNKLSVILKNWDELLNHGPITTEKVIICKNAIKRFGDSSVSELIAWRFPEEFPIMNSCSEKGLKFFGVKI